MSTYFVYMMHCRPAAAHQALRHPRCDWQLAELPAGAASLLSPVALLAALAPVQPASAIHAESTCRRYTKENAIPCSRVNTGITENKTPDNVDVCVCMRLMCACGNRLSMYASLQVGAASHLRQLSLKQIACLRRSRWCSSCSMFSCCQRCLIKDACAFCVPCLHFLKVCLQDNNIL